MNDHPHDDDPPRGIFDSLRALLDTILAILHNRTELLTTEIEEELTRLVGVLVWAVVAVFSVIIGGTFLGTMILLATPEAYRALAAAGLGLLFLVVAGIGYLSIRKILRAKPRPFDATLRELEKDREHLRRGR
jgi:uncharacterized membrane protein YqjE